MTIVENLVYDINANDGIGIHDKNWSDNPQGVGGSHWVVDNVVVGNSSMEEGIDYASGSTDLPGSQDVKIINNRISARAVPGLSTFTGSAAGCIIAGYEGNYLRIIGNITTESLNRVIGVKNSTEPHLFAHITGNLICHVA